MACSMRSRFNVEVISWLTAVQCFEDFYLPFRAEQARVKCSALDAVSVRLVSVNKSSSIKRCAIKFIHDLDDAYKGATIRGGSEHQ